MRRPFRLSRGHFGPLRGLITQRWRPPQAACCLRQSQSGRICKFFPAIAPACRATFAPGSDHRPGPRRRRCLALRRSPAITRTPRHGRAARFRPSRRMALPIEGPFRMDIAALATRTSRPLAPRRAHSHPGAGRRGRRQFRAFRHADGHGRHRHRALRKAPALRRGRPPTGPTATGSSCPMAMAPCCFMRCSI